MSASVPSFSCLREKDEPAFKVYIQTNLTKEDPCP